MRITTKALNAALLVVALGTLALAQTKQSITASGSSIPLGAKAVFHFKDAYDAELNRCGDRDEACMDATTRRFKRTALGQIGLCKDDECKARVMRRFGATAEAIAFSRLFGFTGFMTSFLEMGRVSTARVTFTGWINDNERILLVNGSPPLMDVEGCGIPHSLTVAREVVEPDRDDCLAGLDIMKDPLYKLLEP
jgi:hypothetical protein